MISVVILINGAPIFARTARRVNGKEGELCTYCVDDGKIIKSHYDDGAVKLAIKMLKGVKEP